MVSRWLIRRLSALPPERRRLWATKSAVWLCVLWALSHVGLIVLPEWFFEHVMLALSVGAILIGNVDIVCTTDVKVDTASESSADGT